MQTAGGPGLALETWEPSRELFVSGVTAIQVIVVRAQVHQGTKGHSAQRVGLDSCVQGRVDLIQAFRVRCQVDNRKLAWRFGVDRLRIDFVLAQRAVGEQFLQQRHDQLLAERLHRVLRRVRL